MGDKDTYSPCGAGTEPRPSRLLSTAIHLKSLKARGQRSGTQRSSHSRWLAATPAISAPSAPQASLPPSQQQKVTVAGVTAKRGIRGARQRLAKSVHLALLARLGPTAIAQTRIFAPITRYAIAIAFAKFAMAFAAMGAMINAMVVVGAQLGVFDWIQVR